MSNTIAEPDSTCASTCLATGNGIVKCRRDSSAPLQKGDKVMVKERRNSFEELRVSDEAAVHCLAANGILLLACLVPSMWAPELCTLMFKSLYAAAQEENRLVIKAVKQLVKNELQQFATTVQDRIVSGRPMKEKQDMPGFAAKVDVNLAAFQPYLEKTGT